MSHSSVLRQHSAHITSLLDPDAEGQVSLPHHKKETEAHEARNVPA